MSETSVKIFCGTDEVGRKIKQLIRKHAEEKHFGNMSRMMIWDFCEKYGYDPRTGEQLRLPAPCELPQKTKSETKPGHKKYFLRR